MAEQTRQEIQQEIEKYIGLIANHAELSEQTVTAHLTLGKLYERGGDKAAAIQEFAKVALFYADQGQIIKAMAAAQLIVRLAPDNEEIIDRLGELYFLRQTVSDDQMSNYQEFIANIEQLQSDQHASPESSDDNETINSEESIQTVETQIDVIAALKHIPLFAKLSVSELQGIYTHSLLRQFPPNQPILANGNTQRSLFVILEGSVHVFGKDKQQRKTFLARLKTGNSFGEFALFGRIDPNLSVSAEQQVTLLEVPRDIVLKLAKNRPQLTETLKSLLRERMLDTALASVPLFSQLSPHHRREIIPYFKALRGKQGVTIVRESDPGDSMYFLTAGKVGVYTSLGEAAEEEPLLLATLKSGDFFGEQALVTDEPRSATIIALTDVILLKLSKEDLLALMNTHPEIESTLQFEAYKKQMRKKLSILKQILPAESAS